MYLPDVLKADTLLRRTLEKYGIYFDVENAKLTINSSTFQLNKYNLDCIEYTKINNEALGQVARAIYLDYTSMMLYMDNPWNYGAGLWNHPEFMNWLAKLGPSAEKIRNFWKNHSKGYLLTVLVPFSSINFSNFGFDSQNEFICDSNTGYMHLKHKLLSMAIDVAFTDKTSEYFLFIKRGVILPYCSIRDIEERISNHNQDKCR